MTNHCEIINTGSFCFSGRFPDSCGACKESLCGFQLGLSLCPAAHFHTHLYRHVSCFICRVLISAYTISCKGLVVKCSVVN